MTPDDMIVQLDDEFAIVSTCAAHISQRRYPTKDEALKAFNYAQAWVKITPEQQVTIDAILRNRRNRRNESSDVSNRGS